MKYIGPFFKRTCSGWTLGAVLPQDFRRNYSETEFWIDWKEPWLMNVAPDASLAPPFPAAKAKAILERATRRTGSKVKSHGEVEPRYPSRTVGVSGLLSAPPAANGPEVIVPYLVSFNLNGPHTPSLDGPARGVWSDRKMLPYPSKDSRRYPEIESWGQSIPVAADAGSTASPRPSPHHA